MHLSREGSTWHSLTVCQFLTELRFKWIPLIICPSIKTFSIFLCPRTSFQPSLIMQASDIDIGQASWYYTVLRFFKVCLITFKVTAHVGLGKVRSKALLWRNFYVLWRITLSNACKISKILIAEIKSDGARAYPT